MGALGSDLDKNTTGQKNEPTSGAKDQILRIPIDETSALDCLDVMKQEYERERSKRQSFETRAGLIITILAALCIFIFDRVNISDMLHLMTAPCSFFVFAKILSGWTVYASFVLSLYFVVKTVKVKEYSNLNILAINEYFMGKPRIQGVIELTNAYRKITTQHRSVNSINAQSLQRSIFWMSIAILAIIIYINF